MPFSMSSTLTTANAQRSAHWPETPALAARSRRLRIQKGLARSDFGPNLSAKTVGRIERGEVEKPRGRTLVLLAKKLKVPVDEIASY